MSELSTILSPETLCDDDIIGVIRRLTGEKIILSIKYDHILSFLAKCHSDLSDVELINLIQLTSNNFERDFDNLMGKNRNTIMSLFMKWFGDHLIYVLIFRRNIEWELLKTNFDLKKLIKSSTTYREFYQNLSQVRGYTNGFRFSNDLSALFDYIDNRLRMTEYAYINF